MRGPAGRLFVALLLAVTAAICIAELSGRWDQTIRDADDEAGIVAIVLCVGAAIAIAGTALERRPPVDARFLPVDSCDHLRRPIAISVTILASIGPPIPLRV